MFMVKNFSKYLFGDSSKETIIDIPQGQLYLVRPLSPKGYSELIYKDAVATIRRTGQEHHFQLVVQRAYEEGEAELADDDEQDRDGSDQDEKTFLLDEALHFRSERRDGGEHVLAWRDLSGDPGDLYEFICDVSVQADKVNTFYLAAVECQYERKYRKSAQQATDAELQQFHFDHESALPGASSVSSLTDLLPTSKQSADHMAKEVARSSKKASTPAVAAVATTTAPVARSAPETGEALTRQTAELHLYDFATGTFILQDPSVIATVIDQGKWEYWLQITSSTGEDRLGQPVVADINPVFNFEYLSFIFNHYADDGSAYSWLLRFKDHATLEDFQEGLMQALWEQLNEVKWKTRSEHYDTDEEEDDVDLHDKDGNINSQLAVGTAHDRSFVVRGSKIGVFKHLPNRNLEFSTNISKIETPKGKLFSPKKVMLHAQDQNMILQNEADPNSLYRMDLEYGKIVDEWKIHDDLPITNFAPEHKFDQRTGAQPFIGHNRNALFKIDPRLSGNKMVEESLKQYASKNDFSAAATTEKGYVAVASNKGDIRLFDRLGINAKTLLPALGEAIIGIDVSADGRWILATCRTYLLLIDALQKTGKNEGKLGFEKAFGKDSKPQPRRLGLTPSHVAQFQHETGQPLSFTTAKFNTGEGTQETSIITSTGPFLVTWSLKKVVNGTKDPYNIRRYGDTVVADNFEYGSDKNVILTLPNEVDMVSRKSFKKPTRESIAGPVGRLSGAGFKTPRKSALRNEVVNSPY
ncbi:hypothetical protein DV738_g1873, partial [Chaetothyriales sp. CBS 135597]